MLERGFYVYLGSALGPGGLRGRPGHRRRILKRPYWRVDYLRAYMRLGRAWFCYDTERHEHQWAAVLSRSERASKTFTEVWGVGLFLPVSSLPSAPTAVAPPFSFRLARR